MKQAILITAYDSFDQLNLLLDQFDDYFNIYIHIDKKSDLEELRLMELLKKKNVKYAGRDYTVNWGGVNHLKSYLKLAEIAMKDTENVYFHLITGKDFPIKGNKYFRNLVDGKSALGKDYMDHFRMPADCWKDGGMKRLEYYNFYDLFNAKKSDKWIWRFIRLQEILKIKRKIKANMGELFGGSTYWSLSRNTLDYVLSYTAQNPNFLKRFKHTFCAEEIYFQTIIMNSPYAENVINNNKRFIDWESGKGGYPAFLDEQDFNAIVESDSLFARKIDMTNSTLVHLLQKHKNN